MFCPAKVEVKRMRKQATDLQKTIAEDAFDRGLLFNTYKELLKLNNKKMNNLI